jgi:uncharacterized membrane protein
MFGRPQGPRGAAAATEATTEHYEARVLQMYIWQIPHMLVNGSIYMFVAGLAVLVWNAADRRDGKLAWGDETKVR